MRNPSWLVLLLPLLGSAAPAIAGTGIPDPTTSDVWCLQGDCQQTAQLMVCPCGSGDAVLSEAVIGITIRDTLGDPIAMYPLQDIWLDGSILSGSPRACPGETTADHNTDVIGFTTVTTSDWPFGGWAPLANLRVWVAGMEFGPTFFALTVNSPDIDGDGSVNLVDLGLLAEDYNGESAPEVWFRSDFNFDGVLNLTDVGKFAFHYGHSCL